MQNSEGGSVDVSMIREEAQGRARWPEPWSGYDRSDVEALQGLVADGVEKGFLTYDEIAAGLEDVVLRPEQIEDFYTYLLDLGRVGRGGAAQAAAARAARDS